MSTVNYSDPITFPSLKASGLVPAGTPPPSTPTISATSLNQSPTPINNPYPFPASNLSSTVAGGNAVLGANTTSVTQVPATDTTSLFDKYLSSLPKVPSSADQYSTDYATSGIDQKQQQANLDAQTYKTAQAKLAAINAQMQGITAEGQTANLQQDARQTPQFQISGQQAENNRQTAIRLLPYQMQAFTAQAEAAAAQGNAQLSQSILQQAQQHLDTVYQIHQQDATNQYNYQKDLITVAYNFADKQQQAQLDALKTQKAQDFTAQQNALNQAQTLANTAITNGNPAVAAKILALDPKSATYAEDVGKLAGQITQNPLDVRLKEAQIASANRANQDASVPTVKTINGVDMQWNPTTKKWDAITSVGTAAADKTQNAIDQLAFLRSTAKTATNLADAAGPSAITRTLGDVFVGDSKFRQLEAQTNTLRTNVLSLMTDPAIKKFFGPQMSDADVRLMTAAGTTLNPQNQSPGQMKTEIKRLDDLFIRMQNALGIGTKIEASGGYMVIAPDGTQVHITD